MQKKSNQMPMQMVFNPGNQVLASASFGKDNALGVQ